MEITYLTEHTLSSRQNQLLVVLVTMINLANKTILQRKSRKINTNNKTNIIGTNNQTNNGQTRTRNGQYDIVMYHTSGQDLIPITGIKRP